MTSFRSSPRSARTAPASGRAGFTLIEIMVSVMLFVVGVLAICGSSSVVMTMIGGSQRRTIAAVVAESRFERLRAVPCTAHASGSATTRGVREVWTTVPLVRADDVTVQVTFASSGGRVTSQTYRSYLAC